MLAEQATHLADARWTTGRVRHVLTEPLLLKN
jgi:hypothetical protein